MKIAIACDHGGFLSEHIQKNLVITQIMHRKRLRQLPMANVIEVL